MVLSVVLQEEYVSQMQCAKCSNTAGASGFEVSCLYSCGPKAAVIITSSSMHQPPCCHQSQQLTSQGMYVSIAIIGVGALS